MLVNTHLMAEMVLRRVAASEVVIHDVETSGLDWRHNHIVGHVITVGPLAGDTFYIPVRHAPGNNLPADIQVPQTDNGWRGEIHPFEVSMIKAYESKMTVFHNGAFDMRFMHKIGWKPSGPIEDTMIMAYLTDELRRSLSLDACCKEEKVAEKKGDQLYKYLSEKFGCAADKSSMAFYWRADPADTVVWDYASGDGTSTWQLRDVLKAQIIKPYYSTATRDYTLERVAKVEMLLIPILHRMSMRGIIVDEERLEELTRLTQIELETGEKALGGINVRSPIAMEKYFTDAGITEWMYTESTMHLPIEKRRKSFDAAFLATNAPGREIIKVRKNKTMLTNFLQPMKDRYLYNGKVYAEIHQTRDEEFGTRTGRLSVSNPNLTAIPGKRQKDAGRRFRSIFVPDPGKKFIEADYRTCEIVICTHYCKAKLWLDGFMNGVDPHTSISEGIGITRQHAKTINLAIMTGAGKKEIASQLGIGLVEGSKIVDQYFDGLPELKEFQKISTKNFRNRGFVATLLGRRLQLADPNKGYTGVNRLTQGGNADITKAALIAMDPYVELKMPVHDSVLFQGESINDPEVQKGMQAMVDVCGDLGLEVPMEAEYGEGINWGEATFNVMGKVRWEPANGNGT